MTVNELWWLSLMIAAGVIVVVAVLLGLIIAAAKSVDRHACDIWTVGKQIAGNTVSIWMLEKAEARLRRVEHAAKSLEQSVTCLDRRLRSLAEKGE